MINPYQPTSDLSQPDKKAPATKLRTQIALIFVAVGFVAVYNSVQLQRIPSGRPVPLWPSLAVPFALSVFSAVRSRFTYVPPLAAIFGVMTASVAFAAFRSWAAAELHIALAVGIVLSIPSLVLARRSRTKYSLALN